MDRKDKQEQVRRYLRQAKHARTREEEQELQRRAKARKAGRTERGPRRRGSWDDEDELDALAGVERMGARSRPAEPPGRGTSTPERSTPSGAGQDAHAGAADARPDGAHEALVVALTVGRARLWLADGTPLEAELARELAARQQSAVAVGDRVVLEEREPGRWRVVGVRPRTSVLARPDPARPELERVLAANVDVAVMVVSLVRPAFRPRLLDRLLVALERGGVAPVACVTKLDLAGPEDRARMARELEPYRRLGVPCVAVSSVSGEGIEELRGLVRAKTCVLVGHSGVGKSSLVNALAPGLGLREGAVREGDGKGRHTTTGSALFELPGVGPGTRLIDTPGVRAFGLHDLTPAELEAAFPELVALAAGCRFRDCAHVAEPDCAVRAAAEAEDGRLAPARYRAWLRLRESLGP